METMLSTALQEFLGLLKQLITNLLGRDAQEWADELKRFLRKKPCWAKDMIHAPLIWSEDNFGIVCPESLDLECARYGVLTGSMGWRVPTQDELVQAMKQNRDQFVSDQEYWSEKEGENFTCVKIYPPQVSETDICRGTIGPTRIGHYNLRLRLCREADSRFTDVFL